MTANVCPNGHPNGADVIVCAACGERIPRAYRDEEARQPVRPRGADVDRPMPGSFLSETAAQREAQRRIQAAMAYVKANSPTVKGAGIAMGAAAKTMNRARSIDAIDKTPRRDDGETPRAAGAKTEEGRVSANICEKHGKPIVRGKSCSDCYSENGRKNRSGKRLAAKGVDTKAKVVAGKPHKDPALLAAYLDDDCDERNAADGFLNRIRRMENLLRRVYGDEALSDASNEAPERHDEIRIGGERAVVIRVLARAARGASPAEQAILFRVIGENVVEEDLHASR